MLTRKIIYHPRMYKQLYRLFSNSMPSKSFLSSVVQGKIETKDLFPFPKILTSDEIGDLNMVSDNTSRIFESSYDPLLADEIEEFESATVKQLKDIGIWGASCPEDYGGIGCNKTMFTRLGSIIGYHDLSLSVMIGAHQGIGYSGIILYGTPEQKKKYLPSLSTGEKIAAFALTESSAGSDVSSLRSKAVLSPDGKHYILNGSKIWTTNGHNADILTVFAKVPVKDKDGNEKDKITAFILERAFGGLTSNVTENKLGIKACHSATLFFDNIKIPVENVLGEIGNGFKVAMNILNNGRSSMASALAGSMKRCIEIAVQHASQRTQFGTPIKNFKLIQEKLACMQVKQYTTETMALIIGGNIDHGNTNQEVESAISKVYASECAWFCVDEAIQILGGMGYMRETGLEKIMRDMRIFRIFEGTNEILRIMAVGGALKELNKVSKSPTDHVIRAIRNKIGVNYLYNKAALQKVVDPSLHSSSDKLAKSISLTSTALNSALIKYRMKLVTQESIQISKFADCFIEIFGMACILSRATASIQNSSVGEMSFVRAEHEKLLVELSCTLGLKKIQHALEFIELDSNNQLDQIPKISEDICNNGTCVSISPIAC